MKKIHLYALMIILGLEIVHAQDPQIEWQNTIGGAGSDLLYSVKNTVDGGYILAGWSNSDISGDKTENNIGFQDYWVIKLDINGNIEWQNTIGGSLIDEAHEIIQTNDGGFLVGGSSNSNISGDKTENSQGGLDYWIIKINSTGSIEWQNTIGGDQGDVLNSIQQTNDDGYILGGSSSSDISGDKLENSNGLSDYWVIKVDSVGDIVWQNTIGGNQEDVLWELRQTSDNGFILGGTSRSDSSGDKIEDTNGGYDIWIVKLDSNGFIEWQNTIGGNADDSTTSIQQTFDNGFIIAGASQSDISGDKTENSQGNHDYWILKLNDSGDIIWQNTIGGSDIDISWSISQTGDAGFIVGGHSYSNISGDKTENSFGANDYWIIRLNAVGDILWENTIGGSDGESLQSISITDSGDFLLGGFSSSNISGDKDENSEGIIDYWVLKLSSLLNTIDNEFSSAIFIYPNPTSSLLNVVMGNLSVKGKILSSEGRIIRNISNITSSTQIDLSDLATGIYYIQFISGNNVTTRKFIRN